MIWIFQHIEIIDSENFHKLQDKNDKIRCNFFYHSGNRTYTVVPKDFN